MQLNNLPSITDKKLRRLGQGHGSGRGKTSGRGTKGQKARGKIRLSFEGGALPLVKRLPFLRGRGRNKKIALKPVIVNIEMLNRLPARSTVDVEALIKAGFVPVAAKKNGVKVVGSGGLKVALNVALKTTAQSRAQIEKAGGTVVASI